MGPELTWAEKRDRLRDELGRDPTREEVLALVKTHRLTDAEIDEQRRSWVRGQKPTGDPEFD